MATRKYTSFAHGAVGHFTYSIFGQRAQVVVNSKTQKKVEKVVYMAAYSYKGFEHLGFIPMRPQGKLCQADTVAAAVVFAEGWLKVWMAVDEAQQRQDFLAEAAANA